MPTGMNDMEYYEISDSFKIIMPSKHKGNHIANWNGPQGRAIVNDDVGDEVETE
jgi:hypothetical protein